LPDDGNRRSAACRAHLELERKGTALFLEGLMRLDHGRRIFQIICAGLMIVAFSPCFARGQDAPATNSAAALAAAPATDLGELSTLIRDLQSQVAALGSQVGELRSQQQRSSEEISALRHELDLAKGIHAPASNGLPPVAPQEAVSAGSDTQAPGTLNRVAKLEEDQQITESRVSEQAQTKVESGSKYRVRLSGIVLLNLFDNRGFVNNQDFPQYAEPPHLPENTFAVSPSSFGGSLRQSQIRLEAFGPNIAGARTSADLQFDFAGGFTDTWNGAVEGLVRLRTGSIRLDWANTSVVAGQSRLFFVPLAPTSLATLATPAFTYAGNLWSWTPQVRIEHKIAISEDSALLLQAGILDSLSGDYPTRAVDRQPSWGEESGQPAYAARVAWSRRAFGQELTLGAGGYYGRQNWGLNRNLNGWAGTVDLTLPLGKSWEFTGAFYRGRAIAGLGGGIGQSVVLTGSFINASTRILGLDSMGGWGQLKWKLRPNFEINGALGLDSPFAGELRSYQLNSFYESTFTRNISPMINFIYQIRSDILFSTEYRRLQTTVLDSGTNSANHLNFSVGYVF